MYDVINELLSRFDVLKLEVKFQFYKRYVNFLYHMRCTSLLHHGGSKLVINAGISF